MTEWSKAPPWANWIAQDEDGQWYWYQKKPVWNRSYWSPNGGLHTQASESNPISTQASMLSLELNPKALREFIKQNANS